MTGVIIAVVALGIGLFIVMLIVIVAGMYNGLVRGRNETKNAWAQIDVQLKRRCDLVPNLVETVKGYAKHESSTLEGVIAARSRAVAAPNTGERIKAEGELSQALGRLMVLTENYPELKANQNFLGLQEELTSTENKIGFARQAYNDAVMEYNTGIESFPNNFIAGFGTFKEATLLESTESPEERKAVKVSFS